MEQRDALSVAEVASRLGVCTRTIRDQIKGGKVRTIRVGRRLLIPMPEYRRMIGEEEVRIPT
jgi:excisionase family DNA binding protein